jgi:hypothetical protein
MSTAEIVVQELPDFRAAIALNTGENVDWLN